MCLSNGERHAQGYFLIRIKKKDTEKVSFFLVLVTGLEPVRYCYRGILSPLRLPISPHQHCDLYIIAFKIKSQAKYVLTFTKKINILFK